MDLEVFWTQLAEDKLKDIFSYYKSKANIKTARKIVEEIIDKTINLNKNPEMGQIEILLEEKPQQFRYLVSGNYKVIYYVNAKAQKIIIVNVFDSRQNPEKLNQTKES
ncbi:type II toxin-antitoxin system RelE/ParE family toxin [Chryseobacterium sp. 2R14A]|uniref:type II toxin-antitoxin system RelE/ParE family toxin n=1 Tax=Chryseobacterium sp. 2R14A TaxID=3380353 RepID=UPI003CEAAD6B